jgi:hypothetical protein
MGLNEVERAISVLEGRHPEAERIRRQTREAAERRRGQIDVELARNARARQMRAIALAVAGATAAAAGFVAWKIAVRTRALHAALEATEAPWQARGFSRIASNELTAKATLEVDLPASSCFVATATVDGAVHVQPAAGAATDGPRDVAWCTCDASHATIDAPQGPAPVGLSVLRVDASVLGGPLARSWVDLTPGAWGDGGKECAEATLDGWLATRHPPDVAPEAPWLDESGALRRAGFRVAATVEGEHPFALVNGAAGDCMLAVAKAGEPLSLRAPGGTRRIAGAAGALAWCSSSPEIVTVWREGTGPAAVVKAPALRVGGLLGVRESADAAGVKLAPEATWIRPGDMAWDAGALLHASSLSDVASFPLAVDPGAPDARVAALALAPEANAVSEPEGVVIACDPPLALGVRETLCAHSAPVAWFNKKDAPAGAARGSLPVWLKPLEGRRELDALARIPELLALTRRMAREGYEATSLEGVTELADGVRIVGRAGEDAVVAVGLEPKPPWALPYFDAVKGSIPWDLGDAPRVVALKPGESVKLTSSPLSSAPLAARRTVVFRHAVAQ